MGKVAKLRVEIKSLEGEISVLETQESKRPEMLKKLGEELSKAEEEFKGEGKLVETLEKKCKELLRGSDKKALTKTQEEKTKAEKVYETARKRWAGLAKTFKEAKESSNGNSKLPELKKDLLAKQGEYDKEYKAALQEYTTKKKELMRAFKDAEPLFNKWLEDAKKSAAIGDLAAKQALAVNSPGEAKVILDKVQKVPEIINGIGTNAQNKFDELLHVFDPHRTGEKPDSYDLLPEDVKEYGKVFPVVDGVRKQYDGMLNQIHGLKDQVTTSLQLARVGLLSESERLSEFSKIAQQIAADAENQYNTTVGKVALQGVVGKNLAKQMSDFKGLTEGPTSTPEDKERGIKVAKSRMAQVEMNEKLMKSGFANLRQMVQKGFDHIPEDMRQRSPLIRTMQQKAQGFVSQANEYEKTWAEERNKGETVYKQFAA